MTTGQISEEALTYFKDKGVKALLEEAMHDLLLHLPEDPLEFLQKSFSTPTCLRIILFGRPGSGRHSQSKLLAEKYNLLSINTRRVLIREFQEGTDIGHQIETYLRKFAVIPDEIYIKAIMREVERAERDFNGWILDGFPQTRAHAIYLQNAAISPQKFFYLSLPEDVAAKRCLARRVKNSLESEKNSLISQLAADDSPEGIAARFKRFTAERDELMDCYDPFYVRIDASGSVEDVFKDICEQIDNLEIAA